MIAEYRQSENAHHDHIRDSDLKAVQRAGARDVEWISDSAERHEGPVRDSPIDY